MRQLSYRVTLLMLGIVAALLPGVGLVSAQTQTCEFQIFAPGLTTVTITISQQGVHCLMDDVVMSPGFGGAWAIEIAANNVVFDLNGHRVGGLNLGPNTITVGIRATDRRNITIKNGAVRGFSTGVQMLVFSPPPFTASSGHRVEGMRVEGSSGTGISVEGIGNIVRGNHVIGIGAGSGNNERVGINVSGAGNRVLDNDVIDTVGLNGGTAYGIKLQSEAEGTVVEQNRVGNQAVQAGSAGIGVFGNSTNVLVIGNQVLGYETGVRVLGSAKCRDNFFAADVTTNLDNCTDVANNN